MTILTAFIVAVLYATGVYLLLQRTLTRIILGLGLLAHGANLLLMIVGGRSGVAPFVGLVSDGDTVADPLPQALALTAIVISFGLTAFLLALAFRSWQLTHDDEVEDDLEDRRIANLAHTGRYRIFGPRSRASGADDESEDGADDRPEGER